MVSAWSSKRSLILGQLKTKTKSNEIKAIPELIDKLYIAGSIITIDAMGCQKAIAKKILENVANYIFSLKENHETLFDEVDNFFKQALAIDFEGVEYDSYYSENVGHGRIEKRHVYVSDEIDWLPMKSEWDGLKSVVMVVSERILDNKTSKETRYYISSLPCNAQRIGKAIRSHWEIENKVHWRLDVGFDEDACQLAAGHADENLSILRRLAINILRLGDNGKMSLQSRRQYAGWNDKYLFGLLNSASSKSF